MFILLGFVDVVVGALMLATHLGFLHEWRLAIMGSIYLIAKSLVLRGSFLSVLDILAGIYFILIMQRFMEGISVGIAKEMISLIMLR